MDPDFKHTKLYVNPTGKFVVGGPMGDTGLTGRKIIVDTYGGFGGHGGGAFSGKDPSKVDRSGTYAPAMWPRTWWRRDWLPRCEVQVAYAIGVARPVSVMVHCCGTNVEEALIERLVGEHFDLRPAAIIRDLGSQAAHLREDWPRTGISDERTTTSRGRRRTRRRRAPQACRGGEPRRRPPRGRIPTQWRGRWCPTGGAVAERP